VEIPADHAEWSARGSGHQHHCELHFESVTFFTILPRLLC
jgi:hypothetical protein